MSLHSRNYFLASLNPADKAAIEPHLRPFELPHGGVFYRAEDTIERLYFPFSGVVSLIVDLSHGQSVEAAMFGRNAVTGAGAALDGPVALNTATGQIAGDGLTLDVRTAKRLVSESDTLRAAFAANEQALIGQMQQVSACNAVHGLEERLSRWLLQTRDLIERNTLPLTQDLVAQMLGVQRSSVTLVARRLQAAGLIDYRRGQIQVIDVEGLQDTSCECRLTINEHYRRLTRWVPPDIDLTPA